MLLRFVQGLGLPAAETTCECSRLASRDGVIHEMIVVTDPVVAGALQPFDFSYHSVSEFGFIYKETTRLRIYCLSFSFFKEENFGISKDWR